MLRAASDPAHRCSASLSDTATGCLRLQRQTVVLVLVSLWGVRLTLNFIRRGGVGHEDWRYTDMVRRRPAPPIPPVAPPVEPSAGAERAGNLAS